MRVAHCARCTGARSASNPAAASSPWARMGNTAGITAVGPPAAVCGGSTRTFRIAANTAAGSVALFAAPSPLPPNPSCASTTAAGCRSASCPSEFHFLLSGHFAQSTPVGRLGATDVPSAVWPASPSARHIAALASTAPSQASLGFPSATTTRATLRPTTEGVARSPYSRSRIASTTLAASSGVSTALLQTRCTATATAASCAGTKALRPGERLTRAVHAPYTLCAPDKAANAPQSSNHSTALSIATPRPPSVPSTARNPGPAGIP